MNDELLTTQQAAKLLNVNWLDFRERPPAGIEQVLTEHNEVRWKRADIESVAAQRGIKTKPERQALTTVVVPAKGPPVDYSPYEVHPVADLFPLIEGDEFDRLVADIKANGLHDPIVLTHDGKQLADGRNRFRACQKADVEPDFINLEPNVSVVEFIVSKNLRRRHLETGQLAMLAQQALQHLEQEARARQVEAGKLYGKGKEQLVVNSPQAIPEAKSRDAAAKMVGVSGQSVQRAKAIAEANPELAKQVAAGQATLNSAYNQIKGKPATEPRERRQWGTMEAELTLATARAQHFEAETKKLQAAATPDECPNCKQYSERIDRMLNDEIAFLAFVKEHWEDYDKAYAAFKKGKKR